MISNDRIWIARAAIVAVFLASGLTGCGAQPDVSANETADARPADSASAARATAVSSGPFSGAKPSVAGSLKRESPRSPGSVGPTVPLSATPEVVTGVTGSVPTPVPSAEDAKAAWKNGVALYGSGDYATASEKLAVAAAGRPDHGYTQYLHGLSLMKAGRTAEATAAFERSTSLAPGSRRAWTNLARARMSLDDAEGALAASEKALEIEPESAEALHVQGRALFALGLHDEARISLERAIASDPDDGYAANTLGWQLLVGGDSAGAIPFLERAREKIPSVAFVRNNLAVAYERTGRLEEALDEYVACVEAGDSNGKAAASLARLRGDAEPGVATAKTDGDGGGNSVLVGSSVAAEGVPGGGSH